MIDVVNLSPFAHLTFSAIDNLDEMAEVVVAKASYTLHPASPSGDGDLSLTLAAVDTTLFVTDECFGAINKSSVRTESDLAPFKPRCDVIVIGAAHSATGQPVTQITVGVEIARRAKLIHRHSLRVHGERDLVRRDALDRGAATLVWLATAGSVGVPEWYLTEAKPFLTCPLRYELAFGGEMKVSADEAGADRVAQADRLPEAVRSSHPDGDAAPVAHRVCPMNPLGRGFVEQWHIKATRSDRYPAPRIETAAAPFTPELFDELTHGRTPFGSHAGLSPQGFGVITKAWQPRLKLAGTYGEVWRTTRWPNLPRDFDLAYWNGANPAMQCEHLKGGERVKLTNLLPHGAPGTRVSAPDANTAGFQLPAVELALRLELDSGHISYGLLPIDTLTVDLDAMVVHLVWRMRVPAELPVRHASLMSLNALRAGDGMTAENA